MRIFGVSVEGNGVVAGVSEVVASQWRNGHATPLSQHPSRCHCTQRLSRIGLGLSRGIGGNQATGSAEPTQPKLLYNRPGLRKIRVRWRFDIELPNQWK